LAKAVNVFNYVHGSHVRLVVRGDVQPANLQDALVALGVEVSGLFPNEALATYVEDVDALVTGYPTEPGDMVTMFQISSKLGDGLAFGRPVMVPRSPSVADLDHIAGIRLFDYESFGQVLFDLVQQRQTYQLPEILTLEYNAKVLSKLIELARSSTAPQTLASIEPPESSISNRRYVLVWKQNDAALYGRRIDQLARTIRKNDPSSDVVVLEFLHENRLKVHRERAHWVSSDSGEILRLQAIKQNGGYTDTFGVRYRSVHYENRSMFLERVTALFDQERFCPSDTEFILFPLIEPWELLKRFLVGYRVVVDVVDNQMSWAKPEDSGKVINQYRQLFQVAHRVVFNSENNRRNFSPWIPAGRTQAVVPNWYIGYPGKVTERRPRNRVIYSGNLNDRVDWGLLSRMAEAFPDVQFHLVGNADRADGPLFDLISRNTNVAYRGPMEERTLARSLANYTCAVMPHLTDRFSDFMNPLKVMMYRFYGIPCVASAVPGVDEDQLIQLADTHSIFLEKLAELINRPVTPQSPIVADESRIIEEYFRKSAPQNESPL